MSLLSRLRAPTASDLARKRKVSTNPPLGTKRSKGSSASDPKSISPAEQVKQYPDQQLTVCGQASESTVTRESSDGSEASEHQAVSLLSRLRAPTASDLARKRNVSTNPSLGTKRSKREFRK